MSLGVVVWRSLILAASLLVLTRLAGRRTIADLTPIGFILSISIGTIAGSTAVTSSVPLWVGIVSLAAWGIFGWLNERITVWSPSYRRLAAGSPKIVVKDGEVLPEPLRSTNMSEASLMSELRALGVGRLADVELAVLETSGKVGVLTKSASEQKRSSNPWPASRSDEGPL